MHYVHIINLVNILTTMVNEKNVTIQKLLKDTIVGKWDQRIVL